MFRLDWLKSLRSAPEGASFCRRHRRRSHYRLELERLENRIVPSLNLLSHFTGLNVNESSGGWVPPDTCGAAGPTNYVETVNLTLSIFTPKATGASQVSDSFADFLYTQGGLPPTDGSSNLSDPIVVWDEQIGRFIVGIQDYDYGVSNFDIAVSKSSSPATLTAADWKFYQISTTQAGFDADYPGNFGWNHDAFVFTVNMFNESSGPNHVLITSVNINDLVNGVSQANLHVFQNDFNGFSLRPTVMHDSATGDPMWLVTEGNNNASIDVVKMTNILSNSANFVTTNLAVNPYFSVVSPYDPGGDITDNIDSRIIKAAEFNNLIVASHAVSNAAGDRDLARWYEFDVSSGTPVLKDQGNVVDAASGAGSAGVYDVYPAVDINSSGVIGMTYSQSSILGAGQFISDYITARKPADAPGTMEAPILVQAGASANYDTREGDLSGISLDANGTFWAATEVADNNDSWTTEIANFSLPAIVLPPPVVSVNGPATDPEGTSVTFTGSFADSQGSAAGPYAYTWHVSAANGQSVPDQTGSVATPGSVPNFNFTPNDDGTYTVTLTVSDTYGDAGSQSANLTVTNVAPVANAGGPYFVAPGGYVQLHGTATDPGSPADSLHFNWDLNNDGIFGQARDTRGGEQGANVTFSAAGLALYSTYTVSLKVDDGDGGVAVTTATIFVVPSGQGNITAFLSSGTLFVNGDTLSNLFVLDQPGAQEVRITPQPNGTTVNGQHNPVTFNGVVNVVINTGGGNDSIWFNASTSSLIVSGNLTINGGAGNIQVTASGGIGAGLTVDGNLNFSTGANLGSDTLTFTNLSVHGNAGFTHTSASNITMTVNAAGPGARSNFAGALTVTDGAGLDFLVLSNTAVAGMTSINLGTNAPTKQSSATDIEDCSFNGAFSFASGAGMDLLTIQSRAGQTTFAQSVTANLGAGNDTLDVALGGIVQFQSTATFDGSAGTNTLNKNGNNILGSPVFMSFT